MRTILILFLSAVSCFAQDKPKDDTHVDPDRFKAATEKLNAKTSQANSELDQLRRENLTLRKEIEIMRKQIAELLEEIKTRDFTETPGVFVFSWRESGAGANPVGPSYSQYVKAETLKEAIQKARGAGIPVMMSTDAKGRPFPANVKKLNPSEAKLVKEEIGRPFPIESAEPTRPPAKHQAY